MARNCGDCTACCTVLKIEEVLNKPEWQTCHHVANNGCGIYAKRPPPCVAFKCYWLSNPQHYGDVDSAKKVFGKVMMRQLRLTRDDRPDRLGVMFSSQYLARLSKEGRTIAAHELWPEAAERPRAKQIIRAFSHHVVVIIHNQEGKMRFVGPKEELAAAKATLQSKNPHVKIGLENVHDW